MSSKKSSNGAAHSIAEHFDGAASMWHPNAPDGLPPGFTVVEQRSAPRGRRGRELADGVHALGDFAKLPRLETGIPSIDAVIVWLAATVMILIGPTGRGKTSLAVQIARHHAARLGPVLFVSAEMSYVALVARAASQACTTTWIDVLGGHGNRQMIEASLQVPGFVVLDEVDAAWLKDVEAWLEHWAKERPGAVPLVVIDYLQLVPSPGADDRARVGATMQSLIAVGKKYGAAILAISKTARSSSRALRAGEAVGDDTTEAGAESNAIEYGATVQISLGKKVQAEDGTTFIEASISKNRYRQGDLVVPLQADLAHGWFRAAGDARPGDDVRKERATTRKAEDLDALRAEILAVVRAHPEGLESRNAICKLVGRNKQAVLEAITDMLDNRKTLRLSGGRIVSGEGA